MPSKALKPVITSNVKEVKLLKRKKIKIIRNVRETKNDESMLEVGIESEDDVSDQEEPSDSKTESKMKTGKIASSNETSHETTKRKISDEENLPKYRNKRTKHFNVIQKAKMVWEKLRVKRKDSSPEPLVKELMVLLSGKFYEVITKHDASRIVQSMLKYGRSEQRLVICEELKGHYVELSKMKYGKFLVAKILKYCPSQRKEIMSEFHGQIVKLLRHREASEIINLLYGDFSNSTQRSSLIEEFYGPQFSLFKTSENQTLGEFLIEFPEKGESLLRHMGKLLKTIVDKGNLQNYVIHQILWQYFKHAEMKQLMEVFELMKERIIEILHTKEGSLVSMRCIALGNAKDRKSMVKSIKGHVNKVCKDEYGHSVILRLFDSVDDIVLITKSILQEMGSSLLDIAMDKYGHRTILYPFCHRSNTYIPPFLTTILNADDTISLNTTKKPWEAKRAELIKALSPSLVELCKNNSRALITSKWAAEILVQTVFYAEGDKSDLLESIKALVADSDLEDHVMDHPTAHRVLKKLIKQDSKGDFAKLVLSGLKDSILHWSQQKSASFVILALLEHSITSEDLKAILSLYKLDLQKIDNSGTRLILVNL